ncbi:MAG: hypothetical protein WCK17_09205 [Verrucomicrobiota bacterium]
MNKNPPEQQAELPPFLKVAFNLGVKRNDVAYPEIDLGLLVTTTLAMQTKPIDPTLEAGAVRDIYEKLAHDAVLLIEGCQKILSARKSMQAILNKQAEESERAQHPRTVSFADGIHQIVGDKNPGPGRGLKKLKDFLEAFRGEYLFSEDAPISCEEWVEQRVVFWRKNFFNADEVNDLRERRNDYISRGILKGEPVS